MSPAGNKALVIAFYQQAFNDNQPEQAAAYLGATYTQHNPGAPPRASSATSTGSAASSPNSTSTSSAPSPKTT